jgi:hypothetical protein
MRTALRKMFFFAVVNADLLWGTTPKIDLLFLSHCEDQLLLEKSMKNPPVFPYCCEDYSPQ